MLAEVINYTDNFIDGLTEGKAYYHPSKAKFTKKMAIQEAAKPLSRVLEHFKRNVQEHVINFLTLILLILPINSGHYYTTWKILRLHSRSELIRCSFSRIHCRVSNLFITICLRNYQCSIVNPYATIYFFSPGAVRLENHIIQWMADVMGYNTRLRNYQIVFQKLKFIYRRAAGVLTTGGSMANLLGILASRDHYQIDYRNLEKSVIYVSPHSHHSITKVIVWSNIWLFDLHCQ